jgi:hypothetical protein
MFKKLKLVDSNKLTEAPEDEELDNTISNEDTEEDLQNTIDSEVDQEENPIEEDSILDQQLDELREILVDLDMNLYQIINKEDTNNIVYIIGKVAEDSNDVLMLVDTKPEEINDDTEDIENKPIVNNIDIKEDDEESNPDVSNDEENIETDLEDRFDFVPLPNTFEEINKLNPRYGEELTPDHQAIVDYLMNCLIEINPDAAEEIQNNQQEDLPAPTEEPIDSDLDTDLDVGIDIDDEDEEV